MTQDQLDPKVTMWLADPLPPDVLIAIQRTRQSDDVQHVAVMPDVHLAGKVCNGIAVATTELIYPEAVGSDIGCGMLAVGIDLDANAISTEQQAGQLLARLYSSIPTNKHFRANRCLRLPSLLEQLPLSVTSLTKMRSRDALFQLGTLGRGNHFVEFQTDVGGRLWLMIHSGSRGMGQAITDHHLRTARISSSGLRFVKSARDDGKAYLLDMNWAIEYAMQNRLAMARAVEQLVDSLFDATIDWSTLIHSHHNHVQSESHGNCDYWVHRKGALPADEGRPGVIPGSMGSHSYHVSGRGCVDALNSSSHGAGRPFARHEARQRISRRDVQRQMRGVWYDHRRIDSLRDEAPAAYREIGRVMRAQTDLTRITRHLQPILVYKGT